MRRAGPAHDASAPGRPVPRWLAAAGLVALVMATYARSPSNGFIWDDDGYVQNNPTLRTPDGLRDIWFRIGAIPQYYPLVHSTFWAEYQLWGLDPRGYHVTNVALHALSAVLAWRLLARLAVPGAWLAAAVFAVHPVEVESVAWVTERKNVLSLACALASLLVYLRAAPPEAPPGTRPAPLWRYAAALALYAAALFSKTVTASVPAVLLVVYWWKRGRLALRDVAWLAPFFAAGLALASVTVWMERNHVGAAGAEWQLTPIERGLIAGRALWFYAGKLVWPHPLAFFYPRWTIDAHAGWQYAFPAAAAILVAALWLARRRIGRGPLAAVLVFAGVLVPALGFFDVFPFRYSFVADHFQYHASVAAIAGLVAAATIAIGTRAPRIAAIAGALVLVALAAAAARQVANYRDLPTLYASVIRANPESWAAYNNLGKYLQNEGRYDEARDLLEQALRLAPHQARIRNNLGAALTSLGRLDDAERELRRALLDAGEDIDRADARVYLGVALIRQGRYEEAVQELRNADRIRPADAWTLYNLGVALAASGDLEGGSAQVRASLALDPASAERQHELGAMRRALGDSAGAVAAFAEAVRLAPTDSAARADLADAHNALGIAQGGRGDLAGARREFEAALAIDPRHALARENLRRLSAAPPGG